MRKCDNYITTHPGRSMTIYDIITNALPASFTHENIISGFQCTDIFPFVVIDREDPDVNVQKENSNDLPMQKISNELPSTSAAADQVANSTPNNDDSKRTFDLTDNTVKFTTM